MPLRAPGRTLAAGFAAFGAVSVGGALPSAGGLAATSPETCGVRADHAFGAASSARCAGTALGAPLPDPLQPPAPDATTRLTPDRRPGTITTLPSWGPDASDPVSRSPGLEGAGRIVQASTAGVGPVGESGVPAPGELGGGRTPPWDEPLLTELGAGSVWLPAVVLGTTGLVVVLRRRRGGDTSIR